VNNYNPNIHHRKSIRLRGYDYSKEGLYFITICTEDRKCLFGKIVPVGVQNFEPRRNEYQKIIPRSIGSIVRGFKIGVTKWFRNNTDIIKIWQRDYYEHIIRNEHSYERITDYIIENPNNWDNEDFFKLQGLKIFNPCNQ
jgi:hypothetical protein